MNQQFQGLICSFFPGRLFYLFFLLSLFSYPLSAQENRLIGKWVLDFTTDGQRTISNIYDPMFSNETIYEISKGQLKINSTAFRAVFDDLRNIDMVARSLFYEFDGNILVIQERGDPDRIYYFLKDSVFLKKYPEFQPKYVERNAEKLLVEDTFNKVRFTSNMDFVSSLIYYSPELKKKSKSEFFCEMEFVVDTNNVVRDIVFTTPIDLKLETDLKKALKKINEFYFNDLKENVLVSQQIHYSTFDNKGLAKEIKDAKMKYHQGKDLFEEGKYEEALPFLEKAVKVPVNRKQFTYYNDCLRTLGICYLLLDRRDDACKTFNDWGNSSNFMVRNYLRFLCNNKIIVGPPDRERLIENNN